MGGTLSCALVWLSVWRSGAQLLVEEVDDDVHDFFGGPGAGVACWQAREREVAVVGAIQDITGARDVLGSEGCVYEECLAGGEQLVAAAL